MPTIINIQNADSKAQDIYVLQLQIREATQKLSMPTLGNVGKVLPTCAES
jgi:hypothetical protein